jgi:hypothetical protein
MPPEGWAFAETWVARSANRKTGDMPQLAIGATVDETRASCAAVACPLLGAGCYAWRGTPAMGLRSAQHSRAAGRGPMTLSAALALRAPSARAVRLGSIGDPAVLGARRLGAIVRTVRKLGLAVVGYTHGWRSRPALRCFLMASCETMEQADEAIAAGWRATVILDPKTPGKSLATPGGNRVLICPAQQQPGRITCNTCQLCDPARRGPAAIGFLKH